MPMQLVWHYGIRGDQMAKSVKRLRPEIQVNFYEPLEKEKKEYKDTFPDDLPTLEDVKQKHGTVVWCEYTGCRNYQEIKDLKRTSGKLLKNRTYKPLNEQEAIWSGICTRDEIGMAFNVVITASNNKFKVPHCFVASTRKTGHIDFSKFLNSDGSPIGGSIESRPADLSGYDILQGNNIWGV